MVRTIKESWDRITLAFDDNNQSDMAILEKIKHLILKEQPRCDNCVNFYRDGYFCGYNACMCKVHGNLDWCMHPHHDMDGSKCEDYKQKDDAE